MRHGRVDFAPDCVVFAESEEEICQLLTAADRHGVVIIPFGGGSNVAGCIESHRPDRRMVVTANLRRMNRVLGIDRLSQTVRVQAGILGPDLERALAAEGMTLGHFPDSFLYSTVGGWVASRSSGMLSDGYGNVEDMVLSLRMATPAGMVLTRDVPHASNGPDPNRLCIGSEGTLEIITEVTLRVRAQPEHREYRAYLFPSFAGGIEAIRECRRLGHAPVVTRLNDPVKTQLTAAFRRSGGAVAEAVSRLAKLYLTRVRGVRLDTSCLLIAGFEGRRRDLRWRRARAESVYANHGGIAIGRGPGEAFAEGKFDFPHVRDYLMDYDVIGDVSETSTTWARLPDLYSAATTALTAALGRDGRRYKLGCHVSHTYPAGATLYFTFAFQCRGGADGAIDVEAELQHYLSVKRAGFDCFAAHGATFSHHHAVGYEHLAWLPAESVVGPGTMIDAVKNALDPKGIMNPGKLRSGFTVADWLAGPRAREIAAPPLTQGAAAGGGQP